MNGTNISVDGNPVQEAEFNATNRSIPTPDSIGEFRVESGVLTADKGRYGGGIISMQTQSGTNDYHGRTFLYFRNQNLNSNTGPTIHWAIRGRIRSKELRRSGGGPVRFHTSTTEGTARFSMPHGKANATLRGRHGQQRSYTSQSGG